MKKAIWFSCYQPTPRQLDDAATCGYNIVAVDEGIALGRVSINDEDTIEMVMSRIKELLDSEGAEAVFGEFPAPIINYTLRSYICDDGAPIGLFSSWSVSRAPKGGWPTFKHREWCLVGLLMGVRK